MTRLTLTRDNYERVFVMTWKVETVEQFTTWVRDMALQFERELKEREKEQQT